MRVREKEKKSRNQTFMLGGHGEASHRSKGLELDPVTMLARMGLSFSR